MAFIQDTDPETSSLRSDGDGDVKVCVCLYVCLSQGTFLRLKVKKLKVGQTTLEGQLEVERGGGAVCEKGSARNINLSNTNIFQCYLPWTLAGNSLSSKNWHNDQ